jgi:hypothetical protein
MWAENSYKQAGGFFSRFFNTGVSILKVLVRSRSRNRIPAFNGQRCIVLGNGPSLKISLEKHKELFSGLPLICVNSFSTTPEFVLLKPACLVILDFGYWKSNDKLITDTLDALKTRTTWPLTLFVPQMASGNSRFEELMKANPNIKVQYFNYTVFKGFKGISHWFFKKDLAMPQSQNVLVASVFLAINMGFREVDVVGADHTWHENLHVNEDNVVCVRHVHFYNTEQKISYVPYKKGIHLSETFKMYEIMATLAKTFYGYDVLEEYARSRGCKVYNASEVSFVDAFERKKL